MVPSWTSHSFLSELEDKPVPDEHKGMYLTKALHGSSAASSDAIGKKAW